MTCGEELLDVLQQEKLSLEQNFSELQAKVSRLEEQAQELQEREQLLVFFPELHVPSETQFESSGSVTEDMEKQLEANSIRIGVLEQENTRLRSALAKVQVAAAQGVLKLIPQTQLCSQLGSQRCGEDAGPPSSRGSEDSAGLRGRAGERRQRAPSSQRSQPRSAGPCRSLPAAGLLLSPPEHGGRGTAAPRPSRRK
ncbi:coiled-coil domain-containing protein 157 isoform X7 [Columba livia]|uniref:coiled-coil domain-containing protein 157 isoform X7 n=1 Tax=Columba livia TaxID=8932 RepID=UPI0031B9DB8F